jgi:hypothetical protein
MNKEQPWGIRDGHPRAKFAPSFVDDERGAC